MFLLAAPLRSLAAPWDESVYFLLVVDGRQSGSWRLRGVAKPGTVRVHLPSSQPALPHCAALDWGLAVQHNNTPWSHHLPPAIYQVVFLLQSGTVFTSFLLINLSFMLSTVSWLTEEITGAETFLFCLKGMSSWPKLSTSETERRRGEMRGIGRGEMRDILRLRV